MSKISTLSCIGLFDQLKSLVRWISDILCRDFIAFSKVNICVDQFCTESSWIIIFQTTCLHEFFLELHAIEPVYLFVVFKLSHRLSRLGNYSKIKGISKLWVNCFILGVEVTYIRYCICAFHLWLSRDAHASHPSCARHSLLSISLGQALCT